MRSGYEIWISRPVNRLGSDIIVFFYGGGKVYTERVEDSRIIREEHNEGEMAPVFLSIVEDYINDNEGFLQALSDGLGRAGIYPQKTNKDKIKAEAVSDERKDQIDYLRDLTERIIFK